MRAMSKLTLKLQNLNTGETSFRELESEEAALDFLKDRPRFVDVLGVVFEGLTPDQNNRLKAAMRPLDADEQAAEKKIVEAKAQARAAAEAAREREALESMKAHQASMKKLGPNDPMEIRYRFDMGITPVDPADTRELSEELRGMVMAWVAERNEWVESRNQVVGEAKLTVYPGALPKPGMDRVQGGSFVPVAAPKKE